jgi:hypothetical protein
VLVHQIAAGQGDVSKLTLLETQKGYSQQYVKHKYDKSAMTFNGREARCEQLQQSKDRGQQMNRWGRSLIASGFVLNIGVAQADGIEMACRDLITSGLKQYSIRTESSSYLTSVFDRYCEASGSTKSTRLGLGLDLVIKAIPVKFTGSYSSNEQAMKNFCSTYQSHSEGQSAQATYEEKIVDRAYDSFDSCVAMAATGVIVRHTVRDFNNIDFFVAPGFSRPVTLRGVKAPANMLCEGQDPTVAGNPKKTINLSTHIVLNGSDTLNIACTRSGTPQADKSVIFDEATVTLLTNIAPVGNYAAYLPRDTKLPEDQASLVAATLDNLRHDNEELKQELAVQRHATLAGAANLGGLNGHNGEHLDQTIAFVDGKGSKVEFKKVPRVVVVADKLAAQDGVGFSVMLLAVTTKEFTVRVRSAYPSVEGNPGWNGTMGVQWMAYSEDGLK